MIRTSSHMERNRWTQIVWHACVGRCRGTTLRHRRRLWETKVQPHIYGLRQSYMCMNKHPRYIDIDTNIHKCIHIYIRTCPVHATHTHIIHVLFCVSYMCGGTTKSAVCASLLPFGYREESRGWRALATSRTIVDRTLELARKALTSVRHGRCIVARAPKS